MVLGLEIRTIQGLAHRSGFSLPGITAAVIFFALSQIYSLTQALADVATGLVTCARGGLPAAFHEFSSSTRQGANAEARYRLAVLYARGESTPGNDLLVYKWLRAFFGPGNPGVSSWRLPRVLAVRFDGEVS